MTTLTAAPLTPLDVALAEELLADAGLATDPDAHAWALALVAQRSGV